MYLRDQSKIEVQHVYNEQGQHMLKIEAGTAIILSECFLAKGIISRILPLVEYAPNNPNIARIEAGMALNALVNGQICHYGLRQAIVSALRGSQYKITKVENVRIEAKPENVTIESCYVALNPETQGMEFVGHLEGEVIATLLCDKDRIPDVPIAFSSMAHANSKDRLIGLLRDRVKIGDPQAQADNQIIQKWDGGDWTWLDEDLLPFSELFPWPIFGSHLDGIGVLSLEYGAVEYAVNNALANHGKGMLDADGGRYGQPEDVDWRQSFVDDAINRYARHQ